MLHNKSFVKKTKAGKVMKQVREHYLRDDIYCGAPFCKICDVSAARLSSSASTILVVDTNVVLNQCFRGLINRRGGGGNRDDDGKSQYSRGNNDNGRHDSLDRGSRILGIGIEIGKLDTGLTFERGIRLSKKH